MLLTHYRADTSTVGPLKCASGKWTCRYQTFERVFLSSQDKSNKSQLKVNNFWKMTPCKKRLFWICDTVQNDYGFYEKILRLEKERLFSFTSLSFRITDWRMNFFYQRCFVMTRTSQSTADHFKGHLKFNKNIVFHPPWVCVCVCEWDGCL